MLAELKALLKSPKLWITIIGVSLIPALYNLIFLSSMWNPYGNVKHLPVAVVNKDKSASFQNKTLNIGHDMVDNMSKNKNLDYHFVTEKEAQKGIDDGNYYMVITFPENLSRYLHLSPMFVSNQQEFLGHLIRFDFQIEVHLHLHIIDWPHSLQFPYHPEVETCS